VTRTGELCCRGGERRDECSTGKVAYGEDHSRPDGASPTGTCRRAAASGGVFLNDFDQDTVVWEGMSNPVPGGSARKSAAIIPFVNETLTSGLPIDPTPQKVNEFNTS
jgi:hypothetical protein